MSTDSADRVAGNSNRAPVENVRERNRDVRTVGGGNKVYCARCLQVLALLRNHVRHSGNIAGILIERNGARLCGGTCKNRDPQQIQTAGIPADMGNPRSGCCDFLAIERIAGLQRRTAREQCGGSGHDEQEHEFLFHFPRPFFVVFALSGKTTNH